MIKKYKLLYILIALSFVMCILNGCNIAKNNNISSNSSSISYLSSNSLVLNSSQTSSENVSSRNRKVNIVKPKDESTLTEKEKWYYNFLLSFGSCAKLNFTKISQINDKDLIEFFTFINVYLGQNYNDEGFKKWQVEDKIIFKIPVKDIENTLKIYLGKDDFDPLKAFNDQIVYNNELGYNPNTDIYTTDYSGGYGAPLACGFLGLETLDKNVYQAIVGFYDVDKFHSENVEYDLLDSYTVKIKENTDNPKEFTILSAFSTIYNDDGSKEIINYQKFN